MPRRGLKILLATVAAVVLAVAVLVLTLRAERTRYSDVVQVHNSVVHVRNLFADFYGARVGEHAILFDAGLDNEGKALDALLGALKVDRDAVSNIFLTHGHFDHVAASPLCKKARIHVAIQDSDLLAHRAQPQVLMGRLFAAVLPVPAIFATDAFLERAEIQFGDKKVVAIPFPGHTPGSYLFVFDGVLFAGDSLQIKGDKLDFAMPWSSVDMAENRRGVARLKALLDGQKVEVVCTGHQGCTRPADTQRMLDALIARAAQ
jgi:glyoxylase-like metal-dependent hydrolase (beta-lactamase superfamily II)